MFLWGIFCHVNEQNLRNWKSDKNISCYSSTNFPLEALDSHIQRDNANSITTMCSLVEIIIARLGNNTTFTASSQLLWMLFWNRQFGETYSAFNRKTQIVKKVQHTTHHLSDRIDFSHSSHPINLFTKA